MYKCVYFFLDPSSDNPDLKSGPKFKSRNIKYDFFGKNEIGIVKRIKMLPNYASHFYVFDSAESVKIAEVGTSCYELQTINLLRDDHNMLLRYKDEKLYFLDGYFRSLSCSRKYIYLLTNFYMRILNSINLLVGSNIIHNNIGFKTIVVNSFEIPILTNFRFSLDLNRDNISESLKHIFIQYNPNYIYWPPEIHLLCYIYTNKLSSLSNYNVETVIKDLRLQDDTNIVKHFSKYVNKNCDIIVSDILRSSNTWDQYALGMCYIKMIEDLQKNIKTSNNFVVMFLDLLRTTISYTNRPSVSETMTKYQQLLDNCDVNDLYMLVKSI